MAVQIQEDHQPDNPPRCSSAEFGFFLRNRIRDLETLRAKMGHANFIAMDTERGKGLSSIGLAFASDLAPIRNPIDSEFMSGTFEQDVSALHKVEAPPLETGKAQSICFNIRGFERSHPTKERIWGRPDEGIDIQDVTSRITDVVQLWKEAEPGKALVLVTYSSRDELNAISSLFPQLCHMFSTWVDLQPLVMEAYHRHTDYTRLDSLNISLRYAMRTLGFSTGYQPKNLHHAGNDALRTLAILVCLTHENVQLRRLEELEDVLRLKKYRKEQNRLKGTEKSRGLLKKRPGPPWRFPHVAKVTTALAPGSEETRTDRLLAVKGQEDKKQLYLPPVHVWRPDQVWDFFSPYNPDAIGRVCRENCYYVCLPSPEALHSLIEDLNHIPACPEAQAVLVENVSDMRALGAAKREERAKRRQG